MRVHLVCISARIGAHQDARPPCMRLAQTYLPLLNPWALPSGRVKGDRGRIRTNKHHVLRFEAHKRTLDADSLSTMIVVFFSIVESHDAGESPSCREPGPCRNPQPAADSVVPAGPLGSAVRRNADRLLPPVNLPGN